MWHVRLRCKLALGKAPVGTWRQPADSDVGRTLILNLEVSVLKKVVHAPRAWHPSGQNLRSGTTAVNSKRGVQSYANAKPS
jgi:hypothetical protein